MSPTAAVVDGHSVSEVIGQAGWIRSRALLVTSGLLAAGLVVAGFSLGVYLPNLHNGLIAATFTAVGAFVLSRRPGHREGWLFGATGVAH